MSMACIKPPKNLTMPTFPTGPTASLPNATKLQAQSILGDRLTTTSAFALSSIPSYLTVDAMVTLTETDVLASTALSPSTAYAYNSSLYVTDADGDLAYVRAELALTPNAPRHLGPQRETGKRATTPGSVGGHPVAVSLGGHPSMVVAQNSNMNVSAWAVLENTFRGELRDGNSVSVEIQFAEGNHPGSDSSIWAVSWSINGVDSGGIGFLNEPNQLK